MQGLTFVATFRARLEQLALEKSAQRGKLISQKQLAEEAGVSIATVSRWYNNDFDRIDADTVAKLMDYFGCTLNDLIEVVK